MKYLKHEAGTGDSFRTKKKGYIRTLTKSLLSFLLPEVEEDALMFTQLKIQDRKNLYSMAYVEAFISNNKKGIFWKKGKGRIRTEDCATDNRNDQ